MNKKKIFLIWLFFAIPIFSLTIYYNGGLLQAKKQEPTTKKETPAAVLAAKDAPVTPNGPVNVNTPAPAPVISPTNTENEAIPPIDFSAPASEAQPLPIIQETAWPTILPSTDPLPTPETKIVNVNINELGGYEVNLEDSDTAFTVLQRAAQENNFTLDYQNYGSLGVFVKCIGSICQNNNHYWALYYNGNYSTTGASLLKVYDNDSTTWKIESY